MERFMKAVHYELSQTSKEYIEKKLTKLEFAKDDILELTTSITHEKHGYKVLLNVHSKYGTECITTHHWKLYNAVDRAIEKLVRKIKKDKKKIAEHQ